MPSPKTPRNRLPTPSACPPLRSGSRSAKPENQVAPKRAPGSPGRVVRRVRKSDARVAEQTLSGAWALWAAVATLRASACHISAHLEARVAGWTLQDAWTLWAAVVALRASACQISAPDLRPSSPPSPSPSHVHCPCHPSHGRRRSVRGRRLQHAASATQLPLSPSWRCDPLAASRCHRRQPPPP
jgi:hypothetical protein